MYLSPILFAGTISQNSHHYKSSRLLCSVNATSSPSCLFKLENPIVLHCLIFPLKKLGRLELVAAQRQRGSTLFSTSGVYSCPVLRPSYVCATRSRSLQIFGCLFAVLRNILFELLRNINIKQSSFILDSRQKLISVCLLFTEV